MFCVTYRYLVRERTSHLSRSKTCRSSLQLFAFSVLLSSNLLLCCKSPRSGSLIASISLLHCRTLSVAAASLSNLSILVCFPFGIQAGFACPSSRRSHRRRASSFPPTVAEASADDLRSLSAFIILIASATFQPAPVTLSFPEAVHLYLSSIVAIFFTTLDRLLHFGCFCGCSSSRLAASP